MLLAAAVGAHGAQPARLRAVPVTSSGGYRVTALPAGDYFLVAVEDHLIDIWKDPAMLELASRVATRITLDWGATKIQELRLQQIRR